MSCLPLTVGLVVRAVKSLCFFLLHFPLGRQFSPNSAPLPFAEGSSPTTSLQEALWETTLQRVPCHVPQPPNMPCILPCPWGCHLLQPPRVEGNAGGTSVGCHPCCLPSAPCSQSQLFPWGLLCVQVDALMSVSSQSTFAL